MINPRWRCVECDHVALEMDLLSAENPFRPEERITGCPSCRGIVEFEELCDEPGCDEKATCGFPGASELISGYRRTCFEHCSFLSKFNNTLL